MAWQHDENGDLVYFTEVTPGQRVYDTPPTQAAPIAAPVAPASHSIASQFGDLYKSQSAAANPYSGAQNPYGADNRGLQALLAQQRQGINQDFNAGAHNVRAQLAARGMMGGGREVGATNAYEAQRGAAQASAYGNLMNQNYQNAANWDQQRADRSAVWEQNKTAGLASLLGAQGDASMTQDQFDFVKKQYADKQDQANSASLGNILFKGLGTAAAIGLAPATGGYSLGALPAVWGSSASVDGPGAYGAYQTRAGSGFSGPTKPNQRFFADSPLPGGRTNGIA